MIANIDPESAAGKAGLAVEDIITAINGTDSKELDGTTQILVYESCCR